MSMLFPLSGRLYLSPGVKLEGVSPLQTLVPIPALLVLMLLATLSVLLELVELATELPLLGLLGMLEPLGSGILYLSPGMKLEGVSILQTLVPMPALLVLMLLVAVLPCLLGLLEP